jgi:hypothetical protein
VPLHSPARFELITSRLARHKQPVHQVFQTGVRVCAPAQAGPALTELMFRALLTWALSARLGLA